MRIHTAEENYLICAISLSVAKRLLAVSVFIPDDESFSAGIYLFTFFDKLIDNNRLARSIKAEQLNPQRADTRRSNVPASNES